MRTAAIAATLITITMLLAAACGGDGSGPSAASTALPDAAATAAPDVSSIFPVVLEHDTLIVASADGSDITETPLEPGDRLTFGPSNISPDGERTATLKDGTLFMQEDGGEAKAIAELPTDAEFATIIWSPDSSRLAFLAVDESSNLRPGTLYVLNADGSELVNVSGDVDVFASIAWSPDSERISFLSLSREIPVGSAGTLYTVRADGSKRTAIGEVPSGPLEGGSNLPRWSPDGSWIAAAGGLVLDSTGRPPIQLGASGSQSSWSPDSRFLAVGDSFLGGSVMLIDIASPAEPRFLTEGYWPRWSPNGERIAFKRDGQVYTIRPDGTGLAALGEYGQDDRGELSWLEDGKVQFVRPPDRALRLYAIDVHDGTVTRTPGSLPGYLAFHDIQLAPSGEQIAFAWQDFKSPSERGAGEPVPGWVTVDVATGERIQVTDDARGSDVYWSQDGVRIVFSAGPGGVFVAEGDRSPPRRISDVDTFGAYWSPDGTRVAFGSEAGIHVIEVDAADDQVINVGPEAEPVGAFAGAIAWSPDGTRLLYVVEASDLTEATFITRLDGTPPEPLFDPQIGVRGARWSPDGETIAYIRGGNDMAEVWLIDSGGTNDRLLSSFESDFGFGQLRWSPDGSRIAAVFNDNNVYVIGVRSGSSQHVITNARSCQVSLLGWSPDGEVIYAIPACALGGL